MIYWIKWQTRENGAMYKVDNGMGNVKRVLGNIDKTEPICYDWFSPRAWTSKEKEERK